MRRAASTAEDPSPERGEGGTAIDPAVGAAARAAEEEPAVAVVDVGDRKRACECQVSSVKCKVSNAKCALAVRAPLPDVYR